MFYEPQTPPPSSTTPSRLSSCRGPIGWVTTMSHKGEINLAPYSYFNAFNSSPGVIGFSSEGRKDSVTFAEETREFVWNLATYSLRDPMNGTSAPLPRGISEFDPAGLDTEASRLVKPPRIKGVAAALECKWLQTLEVKDLNGRSLDNWTWCSARWLASTSTTASSRTARSIPPPCGLSRASATTNIRWSTRSSRCSGLRTKPGRCRI